MLNFQKDDNCEDDHSQTQADQEPIANPPAPDVKKKKARSEKQREASRRNGRLGDGPHDTTRTQHNAMRHTLRARGLTPWDDPDEYLEIIRALQHKYGCSDPFDLTAIEESALEISRMRRINRLEADNIIAMSKFSESSGDPTPDGIPTIHFAALKEYGAPSLDLINRYKTSSMNRMLRWRRELERVPREEASQRSADQGNDDDSDPI